MLATGSLDGLIQVWDTSSGKVKCKLEGPGGAIEVKVHMQMPLTFMFLTTDGYLFTEVDGISAFGQTAEYFKPHWLCNTAILKYLALH